MLRIAIQKSGRLFEDSVGLLKDAGIRLSNNPHRVLRAEAANFPLEIIFLRDDDIPEYVEEGVVDAGIVGENVVLEKRPTVSIVERLGFGKLPGDLRFKLFGRDWYLPVTTTILLSFLASVVAKMV